jgi:hypothetical protein
MTSIRRFRRRDFGVVYLEVVVAMVILLIALVPAMQALQSVPAAIDKDMSVRAGKDAELLKAKMEQLLARPVAELRFATNNCPNTATQRIVRPPTNTTPSFDPGVGFSDDDFDVFLTCTIFPGGAFQTTSGAPMQALLVKVQRKASGREMLAYVAR